MDAVKKTSFENSDDGGSDCGAYSEEEVMSQNSETTFPCLMRRRLRMKREISNSKILRKMKKRETVTSLVTTSMALCKPTSCL